MRDLPHLELIHRHIVVVAGDFFLDVESLEPVIGELLVGVPVHLLGDAGEDGTEVGAAEGAHLQDLLRRQVGPGRSILLDLSMEGTG